MAFHVIFLGNLCDIMKNPFLSAKHGFISISTIDTDDQLGPNKYLAVSPVGRENLFCDTKFYEGVKVLLLNVEM